MECAPIAQGPLSRLILVSMPAIDRSSSGRDTSAGHRVGPSKALVGQNIQFAVNLSRQKYSLLPKFGFIVCVGHPNPPKGRSYVVSNAGWELRWTRAALKAELACAGRDDLVSTRGPQRRTAPLRTAKTAWSWPSLLRSSLSRRCKRVQPGRLHHPVRGAREARGKFGSRESTA